MRLWIGVLTATVGLLSAVDSPRPASAQPALEPGLWSLTLTTTTNGETDAAQQYQECLGEQLKDLPAYFAPQLENPENIDVKCSRTRQPPKDRELAYRLQCSGAGLTVDALTSVTIQNAHLFTVTLRINSRTEQESALVVGTGEGRRIAACPEAGE